MLKHSAEKKKTEGLIKLDFMAEQLHWIALVGTSVPCEKFSKKIQITVIISEHFFEFP